MDLLSILYGIFLASVLGLYWSVQRRSLRLWILVIASLVFYSSLQAQYVPLLLLMLFSTVRIGMALGNPIDWRIENHDWQFAHEDWNRRRLKLLWLGILLNLLLLAGFKYMPFLLQTVGVVLQWPQADASADWVAARLLAPLGISYFCFECIAYLVDVYRGAPATYDILGFASYKLFFPKLIAGPITRFHPMAAQLQALKFPGVNQITEGCWLIACGAAKKLLVADHLGTLVNLTFNNVQRAGSADLWLAILAYGLQLYLDFSGYVDVARGSALLLGIELPPNFNFPYLCTSIADFWRRWHMTLGDWLRNYLYFPLGGSRRGLARTCLNLIIVMAIAGLWHNPAWGYMLWGGLHGLFLAIHRLNDAAAKQMHGLKQFWASLPGTLMAWFITQTAVFFSWIFFRLPNLADSGLVVRHLWGYTADVQFAQKVYVEALQSDRLQLFWLVGAIFAGMLLLYGFQRGLKLQLNWYIKAMLIPICFVAAWLLAPNQSPPYIYFDF